MAYPTLALHLLISAPGDVALEDMAVIRKTVESQPRSPCRSHGSASVLD